MCLYQNTIYPIVFNLIVLNLFHGSLNPFCIDLVLIVSNYGCMEHSFEVHSSHGLLNSLFNDFIPIELWCKAHSPEVHSSLEHYGIPHKETVDCSTNPSLVKLKLDFRSIYAEFAWVCIQPDDSSFIHLFSSLDDVDKRHRIWDQLVRRDGEVSDHHYPPKSEETGPRAPL